MDVDLDAALRTGNEGCLAVPSTYQPASARGFKFARATSAIWGLLVLLGTSRTLLTQENDKGAIISIRVTDVSGAAVEGAEVRFVEQARKDYEVKRTDKTCRAFAELKPGKYEVKVTAWALRPPSRRLA